MSTECFPRGAEHTCVTEICCIVGMGRYYGIEWAMHPELALKLAHDAGGVDGAWPNQHWSMEEFEQKVRGAKLQKVETAHRHHCLEMQITGRCTRYEAANA